MLNKKSFSTLRVSLAGRLCYWFLPIRKKVVLQNINLVFKDTLSLKEKSRLAQAFYSHLASFIKELFLLCLYPPAKLRQHQRVEILGLENLVTAHQQGIGVFILTGHIGNWELGPLLGLPTIEALQGFFWVLIRSVRITWLEKIIHSWWHNAGINIIKSKHALKKISSILAKNGIIIFTMDQHADVNLGRGIPVDFFGTKAGTYKSLALFVHKKKTPVVPSVAYRRADGTHVLEFFPALEWQHYADANQAIYENTLIYNQALEKMILAHPEQWFWMHRRWKLQDNY